MVIDLVNQYEKYFNIIKYYINKRYKTECFILKLSTVDLKIKDIDICISVNFESFINGYKSSTFMILYPDDIQEAILLYRKVKIEKILNKIYDERTNNF
jgi:hypothetical protein